MQHYWLKNEGNSRLLVFTLGWANDFHAVEHLDLSGYDAICLYDYRTIEPLESVKGILDSEVTADSKISRRIYLIAWSFGVLAAEYIFGAKESNRIIPYRAIAFNGTPMPIDDKYGIPSRSFALTMRSIPRMGIEEFNRRTFGEHYEQIAPHLESRPFEEKVDELAILNSLAKEPLVPTIKWDRAVIGGKDLIFAPQNMAAYWNDNDVPIDWEENMPHYPFSDPQSVTTKLLQTL